MLSPSPCPLNPFIPLQTLSALRPLVPVSPTAAVFQSLLFPSLACPCCTVALPSVPDLWTSLPILSVWTWWLRWSFSARLWLWTDLIRPINYPLTNSASGGERPEWLLQSLMPYQSSRYGNAIAPYTFYAIWSLWHTSVRPWGAVPCLPGMMLAADMELPGLTIRMPQFATD